MTTGERVGFLYAVASLAMLVGALNLTQGRTDLALVFGAFLIYLVVLILPLIRYRQEWGWFHPLVFMPLWALVTGVPTSLGVFIGGLERHTALPGRTPQELNGLVVEGLLLSALGWLMFYAGYAFVGRKRTAELRFPEPRAILPKVLVVAGASGIGFLVLMRIAGGVGPLLLQRGIRASERIGKEIGGHWHVLVGVLPTACLVWVALQPAVVRKPVFWLIFGTGLSMGFAVTGSRSGVVLPIVMLTAIWALRSARMPYLRVLILGTIALVAVGILGEFRAETRRADTLQDIQLDTGVQEGFVRGLEERIASGSESASLYAILGRVPDEVDFLWGQSYVSIPAAPIPSAIWAGKPDAGGRLSGHLIFDRPEGGGGVPPGNVGEAFWNFHIPGVVVVMFLWGVAANWFARFYQENQDNTGISALFVLTLFALGPNTVAFYEWIQTIVVAVGVLVFVCGWPRLRASTPSKVGVQGRRMESQSKLCALRAH